MMVDLFLAFNLVTNSPVMSMNLIIILEEVELEYFTPNTVYWDGNEMIETRLGISEMLESAELFFNMLNPIWWFNRMVVDIDAENAELQSYVDSSRDNEARRRRCRDPPAQRPL